MTGSPCNVFPMTSATASAPTTGTAVATVGRTLWAPVRIIGEVGVDRYEVETLGGGAGGWAREGKTLIVAKHIVTLDD